MYPLYNIIINETVLTYIINTLQVILQGILCIKSSTRKLKSTV